MLLPTSAPLLPTLAALLPRAAPPRMASAAELATAWMPAGVQQVASTHDLTPKDYAADLGFDEFDLDGAAPTCPPHIHRHHLSLSLIHI